MVKKETGESLNSIQEKIMGVDKSANEMKENDSETCDAGAQISEKFNQITPSLQDSAEVKDSSVSSFQESLESKHEANTSSLNQISNEASKMTDSLAELHGKENQNQELASNLNGLAEIGGLDNAFINDYMQGAEEVINKLSEQNEEVKQIDEDMVEHHNAEWQKAIDSANKIT